MSGQLITGDCLVAMQRMDAESIDAIVTDPPYGLGFMGKAWDRVGMDKRTAAQVNSILPAGGEAAFRWEPHPFQDWCREWALAAYRVAKPSAYLLAFGGTRTFHRLACAIEDAGWIIRDTLVWGYASGFPKSKASLKPAWEPIVMARKPGPLRELAIDACRIGFASDGDRADAQALADLRAKGRRIGVLGEPGQGTSLSAAITGDSRTGEEGTTTHPAGRWPANIVLTDPIFDGGIEGVVGGGEAAGFAGRGPNAVAYKEASDGLFGARGGEQGYGDTGTYSRFFLVPKASRSERERGLEHLPERSFAQPNGAKAAIGRGEEYQQEDASTGLNRVKQRRNTHPTVKPSSLMRHLVRLVTPAGGIVLDPFLGSGSTAIAAEAEGFEWIGVEREAEYVEIAKGRILGNRQEKPESKAEPKVPTQMSL